VPPPEKCQCDDGVVVGDRAVAIAGAFDLRDVADERLIDRLVVDDLRTADHKGGTGQNTPDADKTLDPTPTHLMKGYRAPPPTPSSNLEPT